jgi:hypothetical protein
MGLGDVTGFNIGRFVLATGSPMHWLMAYRIIKK